MVRSFQRNRRQGFTLIELLVVVAIIACLALLLMSALGRARDGARRIRCSSNLRQIALAVLQYSSDNDGSLPPFFGGTVDASPTHYKIHVNGKWAVNTCIGPLQTADILLCPSDPDPAVINTTDANGDPISARTSYAYNYELYLTQTRITGIDMSRILLVYDGCDVKNLGNGVWYANLTPAKFHKDVERLNQDTVIRRHFTKFNATFLDGHAEWLSSVASNSLLPDFQ